MLTLVVGETVEWTQKGPMTASSSNSAVCKVTVVRTTLYLEAVSAGSASVTFTRHDGTPGSVSVTVVA